MKKSKLILIFTFLLSGWAVCAQETFPRNDVKDSRAGLYAFTNATIIVDPQTTIQNATLLIKGSKIEQVGANISVPKGLHHHRPEGKVHLPFSYRYVYQLWSP
jgi:hypothetical protein